MTVPGSGTAPLDNPDHTDEHRRIAAQLLEDLPRGVVTYTAPAGFNGQAVNSTPLTLFTLTNVTLLARRLYLFAFTVRALQYNVQGNFQFTLQNQPLPQCDLHLDMWKLNVAGATHDEMYWQTPFMVTVDVTIPSIVVQISGTNGNVWTDTCFALIRDIGPVRGRLSA